LTKPGWLSARSGTTTTVRKEIGSPTRTNMHVYMRWRYVVEDKKVHYREPTTLATPALAGT
jgi:hypothetical protein